MIIRSPAVDAWFAANTRPALARECKACGSTAHHIQQCDKIARFDIETELREQNLYLYDAIGSALACLRGDSLDMAIVLLEKAMGGKPMTTAPDPPPDPDPLPDPGPGGPGVPGDERPHSSGERPKC